MRECAAQGYQAFRVTLEGESAYWTVLDDSFHRVEGFDALLLYLRTGRGQAEGTTEA